MGGRISTVYSMDSPTKSSDLALTVSQSGSREANQLSDKAFAEETAAKAVWRPSGKIRLPRRGIPQSLADTEKDVHACLNMLFSGFDMIYSHQASELSFEQLYRCAYKLVLKKRGDLLYGQFLSWNDRWLRRNLVEALGALSSTTPKLLEYPSSGDVQHSCDDRKIAGSRLLSHFKKTWEDYCLFVSMTSDILMYLDRVHCSDNRLVPIYTSCMTSFRDHVLHSAVTGQAPGYTVLKLVHSAILDQVERNRAGNKVDHNLIRSSVFVLENLHESDEGLYSIEPRYAPAISFVSSTSTTSKLLKFDNDGELADLITSRFESLYLEEAKQFYDNEGSISATNPSAISFCRKVRRRLLEEEISSHAMLSRSLETKSKATIDIHMTKPYISRIIELDSSGVRALLTDSTVKDLAIIYEIIERVDKDKHALRVVLRNWILETGIEIQDRLRETGSVENNDSIQHETATGSTWVRLVLELREKVDDILTRAFKSDEGLETATLSAFSDLFQECDKSSEYLALFFDGLLTNCTEQLEKDSVLFKCFTLIALIQNKGQFQFAYTERLLRRVSTGEMGDAAVERDTLARMKDDLEPEFFSKVEEILDAGYKERPA